MYENNKLLIRGSLNSNWNSSFTEITKGEMDDQVFKSLFFIEKFMPPKDYTSIHSYNELVNSLLNLKAFL